MKKFLVYVFIVVLFIAGSFYYKKAIYYPKHKIEIAQKEANEILSKGEYRNGDIIFQTSLSQQSQAIQLATKSKYSHCGMIYNENGMYVFEATQPVKMTPLAEWIARGKDGKYVIKRLKEYDKIMKKPDLKIAYWGKKFNGKEYDLTFEWSDDKLYCSELIWKMYQRCYGVELSKPEKLGDFDLSNSIVKSKLKERYGENIPLNEKVVSPKAIFESDLLVTVREN